MIGRWSTEHNYVCMAAWDKKVNQLSKLLDHFVVRQLSSNDLFMVF